MRSIKKLKKNRESDKGSSSSDLMKAEKKEIKVKDIIFKSPMKGIQDITLVNVKCELVSSFPT